MSDLREFFEHQLFKSLGSQRYTQDSPVLPDVWLEFALNPGTRRELLLTPLGQANAQDVAEQLREQLREDSESNRGYDAAIAANATTVAARLNFREVICYVLPMTGWWASFMEYGAGSLALDWFWQDLEGFADALDRALKAESYEGWLESDPAPRKHDLTPTVLWLCHIAGTIFLAEREQLDPPEPDSVLTLRRLLQSPHKETRDLARSVLDLLETTSALKSAKQTGRVQRLKKMARENQMVHGLAELIAQISPLSPEQRPTINAINRNRKTLPGMYRSGKSTKADAVRQVFDVRGRGIRWAVIDSGIDARHLAFRRRHGNGQPFGQRLSMSEHDEFDLSDLKGPDPPDSHGGWAFRRAPDAPGDGWINQTRVVATYDFTRIRDLLSATAEEDIPDPLLVRAATNQKRRRKPSHSARQGATRRALKFGSMIDWEQLEDYLRVPHNNQYSPPRHLHGTHVAGILGADWRAGEHELSPPGDRTGIAPEIELYDMRALDDNGEGDEFTIMAAMQFVRYLNLRKSGKNQMEVHGANLSFSIKHEVANFACGRTPVCDEADRLVGSGVVVVAAAGNLGRARYQTLDGHVDEGYRSISITDPGNAHSVITVGATHSNEPHSYGVSYFSSRGPTGDGRPKPDIVAPGENIYSTIPGNDENNTDGTSQAAPHVSGAAALLMQRHVELIGRPERIKQILCDSATDLGREPYFQGAGMLDILRAMQSV